MTDDPAKTFLRLAGSLDHPVFIVTAADGERREARRPRRAVGGERGDGIDEFARCEWAPGPRGLPILERCPSWFAGAIVARHDLGDRVGFLLEPFDARHEPGALACFQRVKDVDPGPPA